MDDDLPDDAAGFFSAQPIIALDHLSPIPSSPAAPKRARQTAEVEEHRATAAARGASEAAASSVVVPPAPVQGDMRCSLWRKFETFEYSKTISAASDARCDAIKAQLRALRADACCSADDVTSALLADGVHEVSSDAKKISPWLYRGVAFVPTERARARALTRHLQFTGFQYKKKIKVDSDTRMELVRSKLKHVDAATVHCADDVTAALIADGVHELVQTGTKGYYWDAQKKKWKIKVGWKHMEITFGQLSSEALAVKAGKALLLAKASLARGQVEELRALGKPIFADIKLQDGGDDDAGDNDD